VVCTVCMRCVHVRGVCGGGVCARVYATNCVCGVGACVWCLQYVYMRCVHVWYVWCVYATNCYSK
jgi:hypothetical protein